MRLSEAIRLGALLKPQAFHSLFKDGGSCALGAALDAIGLSDLDDAEVLLRHFPDVAAIGVILCPVCPAPQIVSRGRVDSVVVHLNDQHGWTRERIATFVERLEADAPAPLVVAVDPHADSTGNPTPRAEASSSSSSLVCTSEDA
jgi:hypothetical protein